MVPESVDIPALGADLADNGVAVASQFIDANYEQLLIDAVNGHDVGVAVVDVQPRLLPDLRDMAEDLHRESGVDTVLVNAPFEGVAIVSGSMSRAEIESLEHRLGSQPPLEQVQGIITDPGLDFPWGIAGVTAVCGVLIAGVVSFICQAMRPYNIP